MSIAKTILKNTLSNWAGMVINTVIMLMLTPYLLRHLGDERYGIYQIVMNVIQYLILLEFGLRGGIARFASKFIAAQDIESLNKTLSSTFFLGISIGGITLVISYILGRLAPSFFDISQEYHQQVIIVFVAMGIHTALSFIGYSFGGIITGYQRYELLNLQLIAIQVIKAILIVLFFTTGWISLTSYATAIVSSSICGLIFLVWTSFKLQNQLKISPGFVNKQSLRELLGYSTWNMLIQLSGFFVLYINPLIIGKYLGPDRVPYYSIPFMLITRLQALVLGLSSTLMPMASSTLATGDKVLLRNLLNKGSSVASMLVFPLGGTLLVMCRDLFRVWLPEGYESSWIIYAILMITFFGSISQSPTLYLILGGSNIKPLAIVNFIAGILIVGLSIYWVGYTKLGLIGAAWAIVIPRFFSSCLFLPWYACHKFGQEFFPYLIKTYTRPILCSLPSILTGYLLCHYYTPNHVWSWIVEFLIAMSFYLIFLFFGILDFPYRERLISYLFYRAQSASH